MYISLKSPTLNSPPFYAHFILEVGGGQNDLLMPYYRNVMKSRRQNLEKMCGELKVGGGGGGGAALNRKHKYGFRWENLLFLKNSGLLYCPVFKAGSSTWLNYIFANTREVGEVIK